MSFTDDYKHEAFDDEPSAPMIPSDDSSSSTGGIPSPSVSNIPLDSDSPEQLETNWSVAHSWLICNTNRSSAGSLALSLSSSFGFSFYMLVWICTVLSDVRVNSISPFRRMAFLVSICKENPNSDVVGIVSFSHAHALSLFLCVYLSRSIFHPFQSLASRSFVFLSLMPVIIYRTENSVDVRIVPVCSGERNRKHWNLHTHIYILKRKRVRKQLEKKKCNHRLVFSPFLFTPGPWDVFLLLVSRRLPSSLSSVLLLSILSSLDIFLSVALCRYLFVSWLRLVNLVSPFLSCLMSWLCLLSSSNHQNSVWPIFGWFCSWYIHTVGGYLSRN